MCCRLLGHADRAPGEGVDIYPAHPTIPSRVFQQTSRQYTPTPDWNPPHRFYEDCEEAEQMWKRMWQIIATICQNPALDWQERCSLPGSYKGHNQNCDKFWTTCIRQVRAIATRENCRVPLAIQGAMLYACIELLEHEPSGPTGIPEATPGNPLESPPLTSWLQLCQRSCT